MIWGFCRVVVSSTGFRGMGFRVRGFGGSGTGFIVICSRFLRFGVSGLRFRGSGFLILCSRF